MAGYLFASPVILGLIIWVMAPMVGSILISFTDWNVLTAPAWIGFRNYVRLFTTDLFFRNSLLVTAYFVVASSVLWLWLYNPNFGLFNEIMQALGLPKSLWLSGQTTQRFSFCTFEA